MTNEQNFEAMPFEIDDEMEPPASEANGFELEDEAESHGPHHHGGRHHHWRRRHHRRHLWPPSFPFDPLPFDDDDSDDDSQTMPADAGAFESEEEAEYRYRHGDPNFRRYHRHGTEPPASTASGFELEDEAESHGPHHHGGRHHHGHRRHRRHHWRLPSSPIEALPFDDDDSDDDSQTMPADAGAFESEEEAEYRYRHGGPNLQQYHRHRGWGGRPYGRQPSFPFDPLPFDGDNDSELGLEEDVRIRDHRRLGGAQPARICRHPIGAQNLWRQRNWGPGHESYWQAHRFPNVTGSPSSWAIRHRWPWGVSRNPYWGERWNVPKAVGWPHHARARHWWPSGVVQEPSGGWADSGPPEPYSIGAAPGNTEYMRWVQGALNDVLGLQLPTHGIADAATRDAIRSFQQQKGLPVDGVVGPDTERALAAARADTSRSVPPAPDMGPFAVGGPPPAVTAPPSMPDMTAAAQPGPSSPSTPGSPPGMTGGGTQEFDFEWENFATIDTPIAAGCAPEPGEVTASHTPAGILTKDVESTDKGLLIADFGIDWRHVKDSAKSELVPWIHKFETEPEITAICIYGYTDCIGPGDARYHTWLRTQRARRIFNLLGLIARSKVKVCGPAPLGTYIGPNTDRAARARNRSVLIVYRREITIEPEPPITATPCYKQLINRAQQQLRSSRTLDPALKARLDSALNTSLAGRDDSFIRFGSAFGMFPFHWSSISEHFKGLCNQPGGGAVLSPAALERKLTELDQDIGNGLELYKRELATAYGNKMSSLKADFGAHLDALRRNKAQTVYVGYHL